MLRLLLAPLGIRLRHELLRFYCCQARCLLSSAAPVAKFCFFFCSIMVLDLCVFICMVLIANDFRVGLGLKMLVVYIKNIFNDLESKEIWILIIMGRIIMCVFCCSLATHWKRIKYSPLCIIIIWLSYKLQQHMWTEVLYVSAWIETASCQYLYSTKALIIHKNY